MVFYYRSEPFNLRGKLSAASPDGKVKRREKKPESAERPRPRSTSKSPRNSRIIPGVRIPELKLKRRSREVTPTEVQEEEQREESTVQETKQHEEPTTPIVAAAALPSMAVSEIWTDESPNVASKPFPPDHLQQTLTASRVNELQAVNLAVMASSASSTLSGIQPPSLMEDSLVRSGGDLNILPKSALPTSKSSPAKMQCKHTQQQRKIPEPVRRALGPNISTIPPSANNAGSVEDLSLGSSASSCQSNLENIRPPTIMADMDNSILSIASIHSEVADTDLNTEQIFQHVSPAAKEAEEMARAAAAAAVAESPSLARKFSNGVEEDATEIQDIEEPTAFDDVSGALTENTLVPDEGPGGNPPGGATYTIDPAADADQSTCKDVTDVFDDDTTVEQHTFTLESDEKDGTDVEDLPRDSRENTPKMKRKAEMAEVPATPVDMDHYRKFTVPVPELEDSSDCKDTSGYKSDTTTSATTPSTAIPKASPSSRQRRKEDTDRFKTHTITKSDLEASPKGNSPNSSVQKRRGEEAERFRTRTITAQDLKPKSYDTEEVLLDLQQLEQEAKLVVDAITDHKKDLRSRSASVEILDEREMSLQMQLGPMNAAGSEPSLVASPKRGPKICKPGEGSPRSAEDDGEADAKGVRGRRRPLFASPTKRATVPPAVPPKPALAPKPKLASPTNQIRGTRTSSLRQAGGSAKRNASPPSPRLSRTSLSAGNSNSSSARSSTSSRRSIPIPLARQGTFTKEESVVSSGDESGKPPKVPAKPSSMMMRRGDVVHPQSRIASPGAASLSSVSSVTSRSSRLSVGQTRTSALREKSASRQQQHATNLRRNNASSGSNSSLSSIRSGRSGQQPTPVSSLKPSTSGNALRLQNRKVLDGHLRGRSEEPNNTSTSSTKSNGGKKEVTSRIANLWKRVEESKKGKQKDDPRIWIASGKVIPESELALLKRHEEQKELVKEFKAKTKDEGKVKSRLSMKLSKFKSGSKKDLKSPTSPVSEEFTTTTSSTPALTELNLDCVNGNTVQAALSPADCQQDALVEELEVRQNQVLHEVAEEETENKRHSRMGSYFNPATSSPNECGLPTADAHSQPMRFRGRDMNNRSPAPASAIVPPFNYNPPSTQTATTAGLNFPVASPNCGGGTSAPINSEKAAAAVSDFRVPALPPTTSKSAVARIAQVRRNDSYVSSMGRKSPRGGKRQTTATTVATVAAAASAANAESTDSTSQLMTLV